MERRRWTRKVRALARHLARDPEFRHEWISAGVVADSAPAAPAAFLLLAYPELAECVVPLGDVSFRLFNLDPTERFFLAALAQLRRPSRIFEFGTYDGATTLLLARAAPGAEVLTLDLPPGATDAFSSEHLDMAGGTGARFRGEPEAASITQILADSRTFDARAYEATVDLVLVDGSHEYDCVRADSANALRMLAPGGTIVWDDYDSGWPGVVRAVDELAAAESLPVVRLPPTNLAVYDRAR